LINKFVTFVKRLVFVFQLMACRGDNSEVVNAVIIFLKQYEILGRCKGPS